MKTRNGLVSNSSSSSFVCGICGDIESGMDMGVSDAGMATCIKGHTFHYPDICDKTIKEKLNIPEDLEIDDYYEFPIEYCPICKMIHISEKNTMLYLLKKFNVDIKVIHDEMRTVYKNDLANVKL
jgi:hypothetical protein